MSFWITTIGNTKLQAENTNVLDQTRLSQVCEGPSESNLPRRTRFVWNIQNAESIHGQFLSSLYRVGLLRRRSPA